MLIYNQMMLNIFAKLQINSEKNKYTFCCTPDFIEK